MKVKQKFRKVLALAVSLAILLPVFSTLGIVASAEEITPLFTYQYLSGGTWKNFNGRIDGTANIDGLRIQNSGTSAYYIQTEHKMPVFPDSTVMLKAILMIMPVLTARLYKNCNYRHIIVREQNLLMKLF